MAGHERSGAQLRWSAVTGICTAEASQGNLGRARGVLRRFWGYPDFRYPQKRAVLACLTGRDCLAILPTGGGKSLCYQVPALLLPGITVVVSPLISLMQDQVGALQRMGIPAGYLSSTQSERVFRSTIQVLKAGNIKLLYLAPERLRGLPELLDGRRPSLLAIDEAHCISEWGHEFRPHYREVGKYRQFLGAPPTIAVTATATPETRDDILRVARLRSAVRIVQSFDRPNLSFSVRRFRSQGERLFHLAQMIRKVNGTTIVYVPTRNMTDGVSKVLRTWGFEAAPYHAGLPGRARTSLLSRFVNDRIRVMVATNAFGMGIDKPDVRLVAHVGIPPRPEAYYQEAGRAGRDGQPAECQILWILKDLDVARDLAGAESSNGHERSRKQLIRARRRGFEAMKEYVTTRVCRRRVLLEYLGEKVGRCSGCDRCGLPALTAK